MDIDRDPTPGPERAPPRRSNGRPCTPLLLVVSAAALGLMTGCGAGPAAETSATEPAKAVVVAFLDALKRGDDAGAKSMLTQVARAKTEELDISVAPPVNDTATYTVQGAEMVGEDDDVVHVGTTWTDVEPDGSKTSDNVVWVVRLDPEGWRVVGMAMRIFQDLPPLLLNFEDPEDMLAKQAAVAEELTRRAAGQTGGTSGPARTARGGVSGPVQ